jgi:hypothetical protein
MQGAEGKESDRLQADIKGLNPETLQATLISSEGNHCQVWRTSKRNKTADEGSNYIEFVIKYPVIHYAEAEIRLLAKQYRLLKETLDDIVPDALFMITHINRQRNVCVLARAVNIWFDIANPQYEEEAIALLKKYPKARNQLQRFIITAEAFRQSDNPRLIDLYGLNNLVLDNNREIRYVDSFDVFFFEDMANLFAESDSELEIKLKTSRERLTYLKKVLAVASLSVD